MRRWYLTFWSCLVLIVPFFTASGSVRADSPWAPPPPPRDRGFYVMPPERRMDVGLECLVDGRSVPVVHYAGRTYLVVPRLGAQYEIRVWNRGPRRIAALVGVDGLSVITGKPVADDQLGYLVDPQRSVLIKGWRRNLDTVAAFTFNRGEDSHASRMGYPEKIGQITLLAIEEAAPRPRIMYEGRDKAESAAAPSSNYLRKAGGYGGGGTGTGYGRDVDSRAIEVPFTRGPNRFTLSFIYDTEANLRRAGVPIDSPSPVGISRDTEFAPPPSDRR